LTRGNTSVQTLSIVDWPAARDDLIRAASTTFDADGIVIYPTETFYGLGVGMRSRCGVDRLFALKRRDPSQPLPFIASSFDAVGGVAELGGRAEELARQWWPGPLTLVLPARPNVLPALVSAAGTVAIRVSSHPIAVAVAVAAGGVVTSTSANRSGDDPAATPAAARSSLEASLTALDLLVEAGQTRGGPASTIVDVTGALPRLLRDGAVPWDRVLEFFR
jgi:L-threonylcarbamoyladenylate synthase